MALIKCPECKRKVSDQCESCPKCGYPIKANISTTKTAELEPKATSEVIKCEEEMPKKAKKPINKKVLIAIISVASVFLIAGGIIGYSALLPRINATKDFKVAVASVEEKNMQLDAAIKQSEDLILEKQPLLDETLIPALEAAISDTKAAKESNFKTPGSVEEIIARTEELKKIDYTSVLKILSEKHESVVINAKRYQLVNNPTEAYIIQCLQTIPEIVNISAVTEDNDPNGQLNKPGGYTATVYFAHEIINLDKSIYGETLIEQGTDAGGGIEVYTCAEDAVERRDYLAAFDGGIFANGTHTVIGTVLVRTSNELTATQQKDLEAKLIAALTFLPEVDQENSEPPTDDTSSTTTETHEQDSSSTSNTNTNGHTSQQTQNPSFTGGVCSHLVNFGDGTPPDNKTEFIDGEEICFTGRISGISGSQSITFIATFPDGTTTTDQFDVMNNDVIGYGWIDCGVGVGSFKVIFDATGQTLGYYEFIFYNNETTLAIEAAVAFRQNNYDVILSTYDLYDHLRSLGYSVAVCEDVSYYNTPEGFDDGSAMYDYERILKFSNQGYSRDAIVSHYSNMYSYEDAAYLIDECLAGRKLTYEYIDGALVLVEH